MKSKKNTLVVLALVVAMLVPAFATPTTAEACKVPLCPQAG